VDGRVDSARGDETDQVRPLGPRERRLERRVFEQRAVLDRLVHTHEVLEQDAPRPDREVTDLGIAHLARRQPDRLARRVQPRVRIGAPEPVEVRYLCKLDRVAGTWRSATPAVDDYPRFEVMAAR